MNVVLEAAGWVGTLLVLGAFALVSLRRLRPTSIRYLAMNSVGAFLLAVSTGVSEVWSAMVLNAAWCLIGTVGLIVALRERSRRAASSTTR